MPSFTMISTCESAVMSKFGLPFTTMMSAILPGAFDPSSRPLPMAWALTRVAAAIARLDELLDAALAEQHLAIGPLEVAERPPVRQRTLYFGVDLRAERLLQLRI